MYATLHIDEHNICHNIQIEIIIKTEIFHEINYSVDQYIRNSTTNKLYSTY